jgi:hypothetical protein
VESGAGGKAEIAKIFFVRKWQVFSQKTWVSAGVIVIDWRTADVVDE